MAFSNWSLQVEPFTEFGWHMVGKAFMDKQPLIVGAGETVVKEEVEALARVKKLCRVLQMCRHRASATKYSAFGLPH
jgi:hypothetical protein